MTDDDRPVLLLTCSGISHTGKLTTIAGNSLFSRHPLLITKHVKLTSLKWPLSEELNKDESLIAVDGCEECCTKKRIDLIGKIPDAYIIATREGITKRGMEEPRYDEIECLCQAVIMTIRNGGKKNEE